MVKPPMWRESHIVWPLAWGSRLMELTLAQAGPLIVRGYQASEAVAIDNVQWDMVLSRGVPLSSHKPFLYSNSPETIKTYPKGFYQWSRDLVGLFKDLFTSQKSWDAILSHPKDHSSSIDDLGYAKHDLKKLLVIKLVS